MVVDVGPATVAAIAASVASAGTVIWNGPLGVYEIEEFAQGTRGVARAVGESDAVSVIGGGDLAAAVEDAGVTDKIDFISTGGGATLEFLEGRVLPGVSALRDRVAIPG
jgi:phosphoglycerate kinase